VAKRTWNGEPYGFKSCPSNIFAKSKNCLEEHERPGIEPELLFCVSGSGGVAYVAPIPPESSPPGFELAGVS